MRKSQKYILNFAEINKRDIKLVGGKNAALGEMFNQLYKQQIEIPDGFAITAKAYFDFIKKGKIKKQISKILKGLDTKDTADLQARGKEVRDLILKTEFTPEFEDQIINAYHELSKHYHSKTMSVAVRSSATAEDLPMASFAGQLESFLNISSNKALLAAVKKCFASLFTDRAISYRQDKKFSLWKVGISVGVQKMVRSDKAGAGVMFTLEPESGFRDLIVIDAGWGLGENVVKGRIEPDEYYVYKNKMKKDWQPIIKKHLGAKERKMIYWRSKDKPTKNLITPKAEKEQFVLSNKEIMQLADWGNKIEKYFDRPMDIEWAKDGIDNKLYIVQARPETVHANKKDNIIEEFYLKEKSQVLLTGISVGSRVGQGIVKIVDSASELHKFKPGQVLVAKSTDPAWEPIMKKAAAIITNSGGRTCHAAIVSRELGVPCIVGAEDATSKLKNGQKITIDCSKGAEGFVYRGLLPVEKKQINLRWVRNPRKVKIMMNIGNPYTAFASAHLPNSGVGLAREEFIINNYIKIHPLALINYKKLPFDIKRQVDKHSAAYNNKKQFYIDKLAEGIGQIAAAYYPKEVIVRFSDFKSNEYKDLIGGSMFEPDEINPMLGWRGASRYYNPKFKPAFILELKAIQKVINEFGLDNINVMIPFCRTVEEAQKVIEILSDNGLERSEKFKIYLMCELPVNILDAKRFLQLVDGYSIGSNDLTQLVLGVDRDSALVSDLYSELNPAVMKSIKSVIATCRKMNKKVSICGQAPSDFPEFAKFLVKNKINSMSLNPDSVMKTIKQL